MFAKILRNLGTGLLVFARSYSSIASANCETPALDDPRIHLTLIRSWVESGLIVGDFSILVLKDAPKVSLIGTRTVKGFRIAYPTVQIEYLDLNGSWNQVVHPPGSFLASPDRIQIQPGSEGTILVPIASQTGLERFGSDFRVVLITGQKPTLCIQSEIFHAIPIRPKFERFAPGKTPANP